MDGPSSKDVEKIEIDGKDITGMVSECEFKAVAGKTNQVKIHLIGNVILSVDIPQEIIPDSDGEL